MPTKKHIRSGEKVPLKLTASERTLVLEGLLCLDKDHEQVIRGTPSGMPVMMSLDALDDFGRNAVVGHVGEYEWRSDD